MERKRFPNYRPFLKIFKDIILSKLSPHLIFLLIMMFLNSNSYLYLWVEFFAKVRKITRAWRWTTQYKGDTGLSSLHQNDFFQSLIQNSLYCSLPWFYSIHVPGWLLKWLNLITAPGSVSNEPGSVTWLATKYLKSVSWRNHTEKLTTLWPQNISFWPKINIASSYFSILIINCSENTLKLVPRFLTSQPWPG